MYDELSIKRLRKINGGFGGDVSERIPFYDLLLSYYKDIYIYIYLYTVDSTFQYPFKNAKYLGNFSRYRILQRGFRFKSLNHKHYK